ncbi:unnamed protein product [Clonostachys solani]|uniref:MYND-type zinc finger protein samB n=1 Tax=Clonostachys solani TaxID=160281 RepID=A0A9N9ZDU9_9HYPO|nr:unnamed protein product [Clonostachys solani]
MREVNFSIPNVNKASVGITTALYDRRALDCTSTLPLINSLNHLAYLTTSSARIRDILTVDGGIERLVCILKQGRSKDMMGMWKWNLAFQCVVNIGVRGTENVRTRVVEADMVPVIATILDNYIKVMDKSREKVEEAKQKHVHDHHHHRHRGHTRASSSLTFPSTPSEHEERPNRRQTPQPIDVASSLAGPSTAVARQNTENTLPTPQSGISSQETLSFLHSSRRHGFRASESRNGSPSGSGQRMLPLGGAAAQMENIDSIIRPVREVERLVSMAPFGTDLTSLPTSPTTPLPPPQIRSPTVRPTSAAPPTHTRRRPSIRHQNSTADSDDINTDGLPSDESPDTDMNGNAGIQSAVGIQDIIMEDGDSMLAGTSMDLATPTVSETHQDAETFNITHRSPIDGNATPTPAPQLGLSPNRPTMVTPPQPPLPNSTVPRYLLDRHIIPSAELLAVMPREEDVLMSLQLLAYVSKYCGLRSYFQKSHLVPKLKIDKELAGGVTGEEAAETEEDDEEDEEYLLANDFNLFPLVEKFTVRYHSTDMQYWAGVVMRNLCRKDDTRGGIRQCAYYQCGKWEEYTRQFAKCRRCRRTKYCSKECQKSAWAFHRHWCVAASQ